MPGVIHRQSIIDISSVSTDEPDMSSIGTLRMSQSATDWGAYADIVAMGNDASGTMHLLPNPCPILNSAVKPTETTLVSPGRLGSGKCLRMLLPVNPNVQQSATFCTFPQTSGLSDNSTSYLQYYFRVTLTGSVSTWLSWKDIEAWYAHAGGRSQIDLLNVQGTNPDTAKFVWLVISSFAPGPDEIDDFSAQPIGPHPLDVYDGNWHRKTVAMKFHTSSGQKDGFIRQWIDGVKVIDRSVAAAGVTPPGGWKPYCTLAEATDIGSMPITDHVDFWQFGSTAFTQDSFSLTYDIDNVIWRYS